MRAVFVELPPFECRRAEYLDDPRLRELPQLLMSQPEAGDLMPGAEGKCEPRPYLNGGTG